MSTRVQTRRGYVKYVVKLKPLTPVHVWSGVDAIVGVDVFVVGNDLYYISLELLDQLPADVLEKVAQVAGKDPREAMKIAFNALYGKSVTKPIAKVKTRTTIVPESRVRLIHKDAVPGSTLKGYIRTAVLRKLIAEKPANEASRIIKDGVDTSAKPAWASVGLEAKLLRKPRTRLQGGFVDALELLMVSDPEVVDKRLSLRELRVVHVHDPNSVVARVPAITLDPAEREALRYTVTVNATPVSTVTVHYTKLKPEDARDLEEAIKLKSTLAQQLASKDFIVKVLREHGCSILDIELRKAHPSLKDYIDLLNDAKSRLCREGPECVPARIGFMAGRESKTIIDLVQAYAPDVYNEVASLMSSRLGRVWDAMTLKLIDYDGKLVGVGWCELCVE